MANLCQNGHTMNYDATFCQRCGTISSTDVAAADINQERDDHVLNPNTVNYHPTTMPNS